MEKINNLIRPELEEIKKSITNIKIEPDEIKSELIFFLKSPSKRIRSTLGLLYAKAYNKKVSNTLIELLSAIELIHNASLFHDDVVDNSDVRRNNITLRKKYSDKLSILMGDFLLSEAMKKIISLDNKLIYTIFQECIQKMSSKEIFQFYLRGTIPSAENYISICEGKTAGLFEAMLECECILLDLESDNALKFGKNFGILYQIKNDIEASSRENDIKNKVHTINDVFGIENRNALIDNYLRELRYLISKLPQNIYSKALEDLLTFL